MKEKFAKLIDVKSIVTIVLTGMFAFLAFRGTIGGDQFLTVFTVIIAFYFGTQAQKKADAQPPAEDDAMNAIGFRIDDDKEG